MTSVRRGGLEPLEDLNTPYDDICEARRARTSVGVAQGTWRAPVSIVMGDAARPAPQA
jgi:hypothetical protein